MVHHPRMRNLGLLVSCWLAGSALLATALGRLIRVGQTRDRRRYGAEGELAPQDLR